MTVTNLLRPKINTELMIKIARSDVICLSSVFSGRGGGKEEEKEGRKEGDEKERRTEGGVRREEWEEDKIIYIWIRNNIPCGKGR